MGFIRTYIRKAQGFFSHTGLKRALTIYIAVGVLLFTLCCLISSYFLEYWKNLIIETEVSDGSAYALYYDSANTAQRMFLEQVKSKTDWLEVMKYVCDVLWGVLAIWLTSHLFYKKNLEKPLSILCHEADCLSRDDISFDCTYVSHDELGQICQGFNQMRLQLLENKKNLWDLMEEQRQLNAAFAHDIRTPLTVMRGYTQMLIQFWQSGQISDEKLMETLQTLDNQIGRMERFSYTMKEIHTMEEWTVHKEPVDSKDLYAALRENAEGLAAGRSDITIRHNTSAKRLICDRSLIMEIADNIINNALRYATAKIQVDMETDNEHLYLYVRDDGSGFSSQSLEQAMRPYFTTSEGHYGLGLTICQTLCKKHGGNLEIMNSINKGAIVCASFYVL